MFGVRHDLGDGLNEPRYSVTSRSFVSSDGITQSIIRRNPAGGVSVRAKIAQGNAAAVRRLIDDLDGIAAVYALNPEDNPELTVYGVHTSATITPATKDHAMLAAEIEGI